VPDADAALQAENANAISASDVFKTLGVRPWYIVTSLKTRLGSEGVDTRRGGKIPPHTGCCAFTTWQCLCPFRLSRSKQCSIALRNMTQSDDASAIAYGEHRILELRAIWHSAEIVLCTTLRESANCAPNVVDYRASGYSVGSPAGLMLERCNVSSRNANEQAASARNAIEEACRRVFRRTRSHSELTRLSRTLTDVHRLWGWLQSGSPCSVSGAQCRASSVKLNQQYDFFSSAITQACRA
jgi:hypothetical protein